MRRKPEAFCTTVLIVINVAVFLILSMLGDTEDAAFMLQHGAMYEPFITEGQEYYSYVYVSSFWNYTFNE